MSKTRGYVGAGIGLAAMPRAFQELRTVAVIMSDDLHLVESPILVQRPCSGAFAKEARATQKACHIQSTNTSMSQFDFALRLLKLGKKGETLRTFARSSTFRN
jgi:hypothetical protein